MQTTPTTDYPALLGIAQAAAYEIASPSARSNIVDEIASRAVEQYIDAVRSGTEIRNKYGWIKTVARRRAIDGMRIWSIQKKRGVRVDVEDRASDLFMADATRQLIRSIDTGEDGYRDVRTSLWVNELIESTLPDATNREIAVRCLVDGEKPGAVAIDLGMDAPAVSSRLARIKAKLKAEIAPGDLLA